MSFNRYACLKVLDEVLAERERQERLFPNQHIPDGTGEHYADDATLFRLACEDATEVGDVTWADVLLEEVFEAAEEADPVRLRAELVQVAAVAARWIQDLDLRP